MDRIRRGNCSDLSVINAKSASNKNRDTAAINNGGGKVLPTKIFTHKKDVDMVNKLELEKLTGQDVEEHSYTAVDSGEGSYLHLLKQNCPAKEHLKLRTGTQIIIVKNVNVANNLANGTRGVVCGFTR